MPGLFCPQHLERIFANTAQPEPSKRTAAAMNNAESRLI